MDKESIDDMLYIGSHCEKCNEFYLGVNPRIKALEDRGKELGEQIKSGEIDRVYYLLNMAYLSGKALWHGTRAAVFHIRHGA